MELERIVSALAEDVQSGLLPGGVLLVSQGARVSESVLGFRDATATMPMTPDTLFWAASMTKPLTAVLSLILVQDGALSLTDRVDTFLPEFRDQVVGLDRRPLRRPILIRDLLMHTSGIVEGALGDTSLHRQYFDAVRNGITPLDGSEFTHALAELPLMHQPGEFWHYGFGYDVLGQVLERITGVRLAELMAARLFAPLGMRDSTFALTALNRSRLAEAFPTDPLTGDSSPLPDVSVMRFDSGGVGVFTTAHDYASFGRFLLGEGESVSSLLDPFLIKHMTSDLLTPKIQGGPSDINPLLHGYGFGLGVAVSPSGDYSWPGFSGTNWWNAPNRGIGVVWMAHTPSPIRYRFRQALRDLI